MTCILRTKYYLGDEIKEQKMGGVFDTYGGEEKSVLVLVGKLEGKRQAGRPLVRWDNRS